MMEKRLRQGWRKAEEREIDREYIAKEGYKSTETRTKRDMDKDIEREIDKHEGKIPNLCFGKVFTCMYVQLGCTCCWDKVCTCNV